MDAEVAAYRIELPYAVFSIDVAEGRVTDAAPIARWMIGRPLPAVLGWATRKGGTWMRLDDEPSRIVIGPCDVSIRGRTIGAFQP